MTTWAAQVGVLVWKDVAIDLRRKENLLAMFFFAVLMLLIFDFALESGAAPRFRITPRVLEQLAAGGASAQAVAAIKPLLGRSFADADSLLAAVAAAPGPPALRPQTPSPPVLGPQPLGAPEINAELLRLSKQGPLQEGGAGLIWASFVLAGVLGLGKSFSQEREFGCMDGLQLTPVPRGVIYLGKMLGNTVFLAGMLVLLAPLTSLLLGLDFSGLWLPLGAVLLAGVVGFSALGTLLGGITATLRGKEVLLPLLLFPLLVPLLLVEVQLTQALLEGESLLAHAGALQLLGTCDALYLIVSYLVFDYVLEG